MPVETFNTIDNRLLYGDKTIFTFPFRIIKILNNKPDNVIVLIGWSEKMETRNIYCINETGDIVWQIGATSDVRIESPYTNIQMERTRCQALNYNSWKVEFDVYNGEILKEEQSK